MYVTLLQYLWKTSRFCPLIVAFFRFSLLGHGVFGKKFQQKKPRYAQYASGYEFVVCRRCCCTIFSCVGCCVFIDRLFYMFFYKLFWLEIFFLSIERNLYGFINHKQSGECCEQLKTKERAKIKTIEKYKQWYIFSNKEYERKIKCTQQHSSNCILLPLFGNEKKLWAFLAVLKKSTVSSSKQVKENIEKNITSDI